jgi:hypothetical protein
VPWKFWTRSLDTGEREIFRKRKWENPADWNGAGWVIGAEVSTEGLKKVERWTQT